jgi:large subunit ribosomal protein L30
MAKSYPADAGGLVVRQVRSAIGVKPKHRATLAALGLGRIGAERLVPDRPEIRGMLNAVSHLVEVRPPDQPARRRAPASTEEAT